MRRLLFSLLVSVGLLLAPVVVPTASAHQSCADTSIRLYEGANLTGDTITLCGNINDLNNWTHTQAGNCDSALIGDNSWDDCASSFRIVANVHNYCVQIWANPLSFGIFKVPLLEGGFLRAGAWSNFDSGENNSATSIEWQNVSICSGNP